PATRWWLAYGGLIAVSGYLNELALLVLAAHAATVVLARYGRVTVRRWAGAAIAGVVLVAPVIAVSSRQTDAVTWIPRPDLGALRLQFHDYFGTSIVVAVVLLACIAVVLLPPLRRGGPAPAWWRGGGISVQAAAAPLLVIPVTLLIAESLVARPFYVDRYVLYGEAGAALLAGAGLHRIGQWLGERLSWRALVAVPGVLLVLSALALQLGRQRVDRAPRSREFDFGGPSRYIGAHARPGDGVLYLGAFFRKASLGYPADFRAVRDFGVAVPPVVAGTFQGTNKPFSVVLPIMARYQRIWVIGRPVLTSNPRGLMRSESLELLQHFTQAGLVQFHGMTVSLWVASGSPGG
ncbi:MAG: hypothetical protein ACRDNZ_23655, partial [Streptosporangiaceae bacterium]